MAIDIICWKVFLESNEVKSFSIELVVILEGKFSEKLEGEN